MTEPQTTPDPRDKTIADLKAANTDLLNRLKNIPPPEPSFDRDTYIDRVGCLFPACEREVRVIGREEQVMLAAASLALIKVMAEDDEKEVTPEFAVSYVRRLREEYTPKNLNPQPLTGNDAPRVPAIDDTEK